MKDICEVPSRNSIVIVWNRARLPKLEPTPEMSPHIGERAT